MSEGFGDMGGLMKQAQEMQAKLAKIQEELAKKTVDASSGGGMVRVTVNGQFTLASIKVDPSVIDPEEVEMLEDLVRRGRQRGSPEGTGDGLGRNEQADGRVQDPRVDAMTGGIPRRLHGSSSSFPSFRVSARRPRGASPFTC